MLTDAQQLERRAAILRILRSGLVGKQADLVRLLKKEGHDGNAVLRQPRPARSGRAQGARPLRAAAG